jgi:hypothetical protein
VNIRDVPGYEMGNMVKDDSHVGEPMDSRLVTSVICDLCTRVGLPELSSNSLRKYQTSRLSVAGVQQDKVKYIQGKHQGSSVEHYLEFQAAEILEFYKEAYHELSLESSESQELKELREKQLTQNGEVEQLKDEVKELREQLQYMRLSGGGERPIREEDLDFWAQVEKITGDKHDKMDDQEYLAFLEWKKQRDLSRKRVKEGKDKVQKVDLELE